MFEYGTVEMEEGKPWTIKQRDPVPATMLDHCQSEAVVEMQECVMPDAQGTGRADDWWKLFACLMEGGRALNGHQLLAPRTVALMMTSQLPGGAQMMDMASPFALASGMAAPASSGGIGFGLGGWVAVDPSASGGLLGPSPGSYSWGGAAATTCFIDRAADVGYDASSFVMTLSPFRLRLIILWTVSRFLFWTQQLMNAQRELANFGRGGIMTLIYASITDPILTLGAGPAGRGAAVADGPAAYPRL